MKKDWLTLLIFLEEMAGANVSMEGGWQRYTGIRDQKASLVYERHYGSRDL